MAKTKYTREELLAQYGPKKRIPKEKLPTYLEMQARALEQHARDGKYCRYCVQIVDGVEMRQEYPCASLRRVGLG